MHQVRQYSIESLIITPSEFITLWQYFDCLLICMLEIFLPTWKFVCLLIMAALHSRCGHYISSFGFFFFFLSFFLACSEPSQIGCLPYFHTWCGLSANLGCRSETCCTQLAENTGCGKSPKICHLGTVVQLCWAISLQLRHVSTIGKNLLNTNISPTCPYNMMNFGPLVAEIVSLVWGTPANFNGFCLWAALLHCTLVVDVSQTSWRCTAGATYIRQGSHHVGHWPTF